MKLRYIISVLLLVLSGSFPLTAFGPQSQQNRLFPIPAWENVNGVASFWGDGRSFVAVWLGREKPAMVPLKSIRIFEWEDKQYKEVFSFADNSPDLTDMFSFGYSRLPGIVLLSDTGNSERGLTTIIALVENKFQIIYFAGESEFIDFNSDGIPEILESNWPDGDGHPKTTNLYVWNHNCPVRSRIDPTVYSLQSRQSYQRHHETG